MLYYICYITHSVEQKEVFSLGGEKRVFVLKLSGYCQPVFLVEPDKIVQRVDRPYVDEE